MELTSQWLEQALKIEKSQRHLIFSKITTDSRRVTPGCLFVAVKGDHFDGHDFIDEAFSNGALAALCRHSFEPPTSSVVCYKVSDTQLAFRTLAAAYRRALKTPIIVIAGSNGKTTTKELLYWILKGKFTSVHKTNGSQNGFLGIPITLFELNTSHQIAVIEVGIDEPDTMIQHLNLIDPDAALVTSIGPEHLEKFLNIETIAKEECLSLKYCAGKTNSSFGKLRTKPFIIIQSDDPWIEKEVQNLCSSTCDFIYSKIWDHKVDLEKKKLFFGSTQFEYTLPLPGLHNAQNLILAIQSAKALQMTDPEIKKGLDLFKPVFGRSDLKTHSLGYLMYCDYYNANPASMRAGFESIKSLKHKGSLFLCLGDMLELGPNEIKLHESLAADILSLKPKEVLLFGSRMKALHKSLLGLGVVTSHYNEYSLLASHLKQNLRPQDLVFIKGSRGMKMETITNELGT